MSLNKTFAPNTVLRSMTYNNENLAIEFNKGQIRTYCKVPAPIAYKLFYTGSASESLTYYSNEIKGKFKVLTVKNL